MHDEPTTFGAPLARLARLWSLGAKQQDGAPEEDHDRLELLRDVLAGKMPLEQVIARTLPQTLALFCESIKPFAGDSLGELLQSPETDLPVLRKIKDHAKDRSQAVRSQAEHDVTAMLYYAAIASALVHHDRRITSFSYERLKVAFASMLEFEWITPDLRTLFQSSLEYCMRRTQKTK